MNNVVVVLLGTLLVGCQPPAPSSETPPVAAARPAFILLSEPELPAPPPPPDPTIPNHFIAVPEPGVETEVASASADEVPASARRFERNLALLRALKHGGWQAKRHALAAVGQFAPEEQEEFRGLRKLYGVNN